MDFLSEVSDVPTFTDGIFPECNLTAPLYPSDMKRIREIAHALEKEKQQ